MEENILFITELYAAGILPKEEYYKCLYFFEISNYHNAKMMSIGKDEEFEYETLVYACEGKLDKRECINLESTKPGIEMFMLSLLPKTHKAQSN